MTFLGLPIGKKILLFLVAGVSLVFACLIAQFVTEKYFFDRLYYQKSQKFGYYSEKDYSNYLLLRQRVSGIDLLPYAVTPKKMVVKNSDEYTIVVIGDSVVWGRGVKIDDLFTEKLSKKLNTVRKTKIYALGFPGDNFLNNMTKYELMQKDVAVDLYIFLLNISDIFRSENTYMGLNSPLEISIHNQCARIGSFQHDYDAEKWESYAQHLENAWDNPANLCTIVEGSKYLPKNALYVIPDRNTYIYGFDAFAQILRSNQLQVRVIGRDSKGLEKYKPYWDDAQRYFQVSSKEGHPSALANSLYADYLEYEIIHELRWGFMLGKN